MKRYISVFTWLPRIITIVAILFVSVFAADAFSPELTLWQQLQDFMIHITPSIVLLAVLVIAWKWELFGGIIFLLIGIGLSPVIFMHNYGMNGSMWMSLGIILAITFPFVLVGVLFIVSYTLKKSEPKQVSV